MTTPKAQPLSNKEATARYQATLDPAALIRDKATRILCEEHRLINGLCRCGFHPRMDAFAFAQHQADALAAAGLLADPDALDAAVAAEEWDEGAGTWWTCSSCA